MIALVAACSRTSAIDAHLVGPEPETSDEGPWISDSGSAPVDTGTRAPDPEGPQIVDLWIVPLAATLEVHVAGRAGTASLDGGVLVAQLDDGAELEVPLVEVAGGELIVALDRPRVGECAAAADHVVSVELIDRAGRSSGVADAAVSAPAYGVVVPEVGEDEAAPIGKISSGALVCGTLELVSNNGFDYTGDLDWTELEFDKTREWDIELRWTTVGDWDVELWEYYSGAWSEAGSSTGPDVHGPEAFSVTVYKTSTYQVLVAGWSGGPGDWTLQLD